MENIMKHSAELVIRINSADATVISDTWQTLNDLVHRHPENIEYSTVHYSCKSDVLPSTAFIEKAVKKLKSFEI